MSSTLKKEIKRLIPDICKCDCVNCEYDFICLKENKEQEMTFLNAENIKLKTELKQLRRRVINF
jgi:hypothetical protein